LHLGTNCLALDHGAIYLLSAHILALVATDTRSTARENESHIMIIAAKLKCRKQTCGTSLQQDSKILHLFQNVGPLSFVICQSERCLA